MTKSTNSVAASVKAAVPGVTKSKALSLYDFGMAAGAADATHYADTVAAYQNAVKLTAAAYKKGPDFVKAARDMYKQGHRAGYIAKSKPNMIYALKLSTKELDAMPAGKDKAAIMALRETGQNATDTAWSRVNKKARPKTAPAATDKPATENVTATPAPVEKGPDQKTNEADSARSRYLQTINKATTKDLPLLQTLAWAAEHPAQFLKVMSDVIPK